MLRLNFSPFRFDACSCTLLNTKWRESRLNVFAHHAFQLLWMGVRLDVRAEVLLGRFYPIQPPIIATTQLLLLPTNEGLLKDNLTPCQRVRSQLSQTH